MTDRNDIELLFKSNFSRLHSLAMAMIHDDDSARDIVHDVFASLLADHEGLVVSPAYHMNFTIMTYSVLKPAIAITIAILVPFIIYLLLSSSAIFYYLLFSRFIVRVTTTSI